MALADPETADIVFDSNGVLASVHRKVSSIGDLCGDYHQDFCNIPLVNKKPRARMKFTSFSQLVSIPDDRKSR
jgi:hypothetical protein